MVQLQFNQGLNYKTFITSRVKTMAILYLKPALFGKTLFIFFSFNQRPFSAVKAEKRCSSNHPFASVMDVLMVVVPLHTVRYHRSGSMKTEEQRRKSRQKTQGERNENQRKKHKRRTKKRKTQKEKVKSSSNTERSIGFSIAFIASG